MNNKLLCFLDKDFPPQHSFVDGFLCSSELTAIATPVLVVTKLDVKSSRLQYKGVAVSCCLSPRRGLGRIFRFCESVVAFFRIRPKTVFVRNDPVILLAMVVLKKIGFVPFLIFQNSFPHEKSKKFLGVLNKIIYKLSLACVDKIYVVSPLAVVRLSSYATDSSKFRVIPLLLQNDMLQCKNYNRACLADSTRFVYIGTLAANRKMDFILFCFYQATLGNAKLKLDIVGGTEDEILDLKKLRYVNRLVDDGVLVFHGQVSRNKVSDFLMSADIGISLIPPIELFIESSPTKLGEYLGHGIPVLTSRGIPFQDDVALKSQSCISVQFEQVDVVREIIRVCEGEYDLVGLGARAFCYAKNNLTYKDIIAECREDF